MLELDKLLAKVCEVIEEHFRVNSLEDSNCPAALERIELLHRPYWLVVESMMSWERSPTRDKTIPIVRQSGVSMFQVNRREALQPTCN